LKLPFVSRERFEDEKARADKFEALYLKSLAPPVNATAPEALMPPKDAPLEAWQPIPGKPTIMSVINKANHDAAARASDPNAKLSVSEELARKDSKLFRRASGD